MTETLMIHSEKISFFHHINIWSLLQLNFVLPDYQNTRLTLFITNLSWWTSICRTNRLAHWRKRSGCSNSSGSGCCTGCCCNLFTVPEKKSDMYIKVKQLHHKYILVWNFTRSQLRMASFYFHSLQKKMGYIIHLLYKLQGWM